MIFFFAMTDLQDKIVLVTGGSGGLGEALAEAFATKESRVVITARDAAKLNAAAEKMARKGAQVLALPCDISRRDQVRSLGKEITERWGAVQILINNAGIARAVSFSDMPDDLWDDTLETNLTGAYNCCKVFLPAMLQAKWGRIINIGSTTAKVGFSHVTAYAASKHGLLGLTRSLALETARLGVTVNAICPGYVDDERTRQNAKIMAEKTGKSVSDILKLFAASAPQNRLIAPDEVASLALLMASEKLCAMTGQAVNIDGGAVMV
jgi:NAD(P)-dependent dehydrogenase (short-subunit alcohol dehydrogenase family)